MTLTIEKNLTDFDFWGGAKANAAKLTLEELEQLDFLLEENVEESMTETELNDLMWFDFPYVCELLELEYDEDNDEVIRDEE